MELDWYIELVMKFDLYYSVLKIHSHQTVDKVDQAFGITTLKRSLLRILDHNDAEQMTYTAGKRIFSGFALCGVENRDFPNRKCFFYYLFLSYGAYQKISENMSKATFHWAKPNTSGRMLETNQSSDNSSQVSSVRGDEQSKTKPSTVRVAQQGEVWQRDTSEFIRKFRNYEI
ncbi:unnamed protein product, partial [Meganyctiphanes norvegica]